MTCLHSECGTNPQYGKENYERDQPRGRRTVARIGDRPDNHQKEERAEELQRRQGQMKSSDNKRYLFVALTSSKKQFAEDMYGA